MCNKFLLITKLPKPQFILKCEINKSCRMDLIIRKMNFNIVLIIDEFNLGLIGTDWD